MKKLIFIAVLLGEVMMNAATMAELLTLSQGDTIEKVLIAQKGRKVTIRLGSGEDLSGTVKQVNGSLVQLSELNGRAFTRIARKASAFRACPRECGGRGGCQDVVIATKSIAVVILRTR